MKIMMTMTINTNNQPISLRISNMMFETPIEYWKKKMRWCFKTIFMLNLKVFDRGEMRVSA